MQILIDMVMCLLIIYLLPGLLIVEGGYKAMQRKRLYGTAQSLALLPPAFVVSTLVWGILAYTIICWT